VNFDLAALAAQASVFSLAQLVERFTTMAHEVDLVGQHRASIKRFAEHPAATIHGHFRHMIPQNRPLDSVKTQSFKVGFGGNHAIVQR